MYMFITSVFVYVDMGFIFECIYLSIVFRNEHVFRFDHIHVEQEKKRSKKKKYSIPVLN